MLRTSWNRYPRLFEADRLLIPWLQTMFSGAESRCRRQNRGPFGLNLVFARIGTILDRFSVLGLIGMDTLFA